MKAPTLLKHVRPMLPCHARKCVTVLPPLHRILTHVSHDSIGARRASRREVVVYVRVAVLVPVNDENSEVLA